MATRASLSPLMAAFPTSNFGALMTVNTIPVIAFDASTAETVYWDFVAPQGLTGTLSLIVFYMMASATTGKVDFIGAVQAVTPGDSFDMDAGTSFDTGNAITAPTVPGTAGFMNSFTVTLTNADSIAAGDWVRISLQRDATDATNDTATGDCYCLGAEVRDAA